MIQYKVTKRKRPGTGTFTYHPAAIQGSVVSQRMLVERISSRCTVTSADVKAVVDALEYEMVQIFKSGQRVQFGDVGSFRTSLRTSGVEKEEDVSPSQIRKVNIVFTPSLRIRHDMDVKSGGIQFAKAEVVPVAKHKKKDAKPSSEGASGEHTDTAHSAASPTVGG